MDIKVNCGCERLKARHFNVSVWPYVADIYVVYSGPGTYLTYLSSSLDTVPSSLCKRGLNVCIFG